MDRRWVLPLVLVGAVLVVAMVVPAILGPVYGWGGWYPRMMG